MTMTAREAMQALLDGKIATGFNTKLKLNGLGELVVKGIDGWNPSSNDLNYIIDVVEKYPLDFEQALRAMLDNKTVMCEGCEEYAYRFRDGRFESSYSGDEFTKWDKCVIFTPMQEAKWKVIE